jgi:hypothetical protein
MIMAWPGPLLWAAEMRPAKQQVTAMGVQIGLAASW